MVRPRKTKIQLVQNADAPPALTAVDAKIADNQESSIAIEATQERM
jgi:hypothetical protein